MDAQALLHRTMLTPSFYPDGSGQVTFVETHISRLYFTSQHVYKVKKSVNLGFVDFSSLDLRRYYCLEEVRLNQRLCPHTYLGVLPITFDGNEYRLNGTGAIQEYVVKMKRLPAALMLDRLIESRQPRLEHEMDRLGRQLAEFHQRADVVRGSDPSYLEKTTYNWNENFSQIEPFIGLTLDSAAKTILQSWINGFINAKGAALTMRESQGFIRDGHGDLHAEHICLSDPICIYDCIEFSDRFRIGDIVEDMAFLLMDLEFRSRWDLAQTLLQVYRRHIELGEGWEELLPFFKIYRAFVRGKVNSLLAEDRQVPDRVRYEARTLARRYFNLALGYLCPQVLLLTCGLMGSGKTTVAKAICRATNALHLRSDEVRKKRLGLPVLSRHEHSFGTGLYAPNITRETYESLLDMADKALQKGQSVLVDASFSLHDQRRPFFQLAQQRGISAFLIVTECPSEIALARLDARQKEGKDASDGRRELYHKQASRFEPVPEDPRVLRVDTSQDVDYTIQETLRCIIGKLGAHA